MLDREEYVEQAYFFRALCERMQRNMSTQDLLTSLGDEVLSTTKLPMALSYLAFTRRAGITWAEAARHARALREAFDVVRQMGHAVTPMVVALVSRLPVTMVASIMWAFSRLPYAKELGSMGPGDVQSLIDGMTATAPGGTRAVLAIRP